MKGLATLTQDQASSSVLALKEVPRDISGGQGEIPIPGQMGWPKSPESQEHQVTNSTLIFRTWEFFRISLTLAYVKLWRDSFIQAVSFYQLGAKFKENPQQ